MSQAPETTEADHRDVSASIAVFCHFCCLRLAAVCNNRDGRKNDHLDNDLPLSFHHLPFRSWINSFHIGICSVNPLLLGNVLERPWDNHTAWGTFAL